MEYYDQIWQAIIRPPRANYGTQDLGPCEFMISSGQRVIRTDIAIESGRGQKMMCSHFEPLEAKRKWKTMPCVIYMHGNSSCRLEALELVDYFLTSNITLFCFDFPGCGMSEGEYISLGWHERDDVATIVEYLRENRNVSTIGLWGRSMGAVTALLHGDRDPSIAGMVLDSPFSNLRTLCDELAADHSKVPKFLVGTAMSFIKKTIQKKAGFDLNKLAPINHVKECFIPALFCTGEQDDFIKPHHCDQLHEAYAGDKNLIKFEGDHNSSRPDFFNNSAVIFFNQTLQVDALLTEANKMTEEEKEVFKHQMNARRERQKKQQAEEEQKANEGSQEPAAASSNQNSQSQEPATGLEAMMGLDDMGELEVPPHIMNQMGVGMQPGMQSEEAMLAAAIQASLADMTIETTETSKTESNQISQQSLNYLDQLSGGASAAQMAANNNSNNLGGHMGGAAAAWQFQPVQQQPLQQPTNPFDKDPFNVPTECPQDHVTAQKPVYNSAQPPVQISNDLIDISEPMGEKSAFAMDEEEKVPGER